MSTYGWLLDFKRCIECRACEAACKQWNHVVTFASVHYRQVQLLQSGKYPTPRTVSLSLACNHCANAYCIKVCPVQAISRRAEGIVLIDETKCIGCRECEKFCPYQAPQFNAESHKMEKCTMCYDRIDQGLQPACASECPTGALKWGLWDDISTQGVGQVENFTDPSYTQPHIRFINTGW